VFEVARYSAVAVFDHPQGVAANLGRRIALRPARPPVWDTPQWRVTRTPDGCRVTTRS